MTEDELRQMIERPESRHLWGESYTVTPRLISKAFGDAGHLILVTPLATRPNYFVVRVDSSESFDIRDILDEVIDCAEEDYGYFGDEDWRGANGDDVRDFPVADWGIGCCWGPTFPVADWKPTQEKGP